MTLGTDIIEMVIYFAKLTSCVYTVPILLALAMVALNVLILALPEVVHLKALSLLKACLPLVTNTLTCSFLHPSVVADQSTEAIL